MTLDYLNGEPVYINQSLYQHIEVRDTALYGRMLLLDGVPNTSSRYNHYIHESLYQVPYEALGVHSGQVRALILGGGDCFGAIELLKHGNVSVDMIELDSLVIEASLRHLHGGAEFPAGVNLIIGDATVELPKLAGLYDLIIMDFTDPVGPAQKLFGVGFLQVLAEKLSERGIVATHCESPEPAMVNGQVHLKPDAFYRIQAGFRQVFDLVQPYRVWIPCYREMFGRLLATNQYRYLRERAFDATKYLWLNPQIYRAGFNYLSNDILAELAANWKPYK